MGAIHGKGRFKCQGCQKPFSWRLDLAEHTKTCKGSSSSRKAWDAQAEQFLLETCFLCGCQLSGIQSEEASFIRGKQKLYHSKKPLIEVLEMITHDSAVSSLTHHTIGLCKICMNSVNRWDETQQQLQTIAKSLRSSYRAIQRKPGMKTYRRKTISEKREIEELIDEGESECNEEDEGNEESESKGLTEQIKQEKQTDFPQPTERFDECEKKEYVCECGKTIRGLNTFVEHQLREGCKTKTNQYPCKYCGLVFSEKKLLIVHKKACVETSLINGAHECDICGRRFLVRGRVETHKRNVHSIGTADQQLCSYCGRTFGSSYNMKNHLAREHGIGQIEMVVCELCGGKFSDRSSLRNHMKNIHGERKYECETCGKKFATPGMRNHHMNEMHNNTYNYECSICGEQFNVSFKYRYHMRKMHNTLQYSCDDCGRTFIMRSDLYRHVRGVHMGIRDPKRYPCKVCGRLFPSMYKVKRHMSSHGYLSSKATKHLEQHVPEIDPTTNALRTSDSAAASVLADAVAENSDGTSIDVHQLQAPHITTLTPEILQGGPDMVEAETMVVGSMSSIQSLAQTIMPMHQMIVIQDSVSVPGHTDFTVAPSSSQVISASPAANQVISVSQSGGNQVISVPQSGNQVISVPQSSNQVISVQSSGQVISIPQSSGQVITVPSVSSQVISVPSVNSQVLTGSLHTSQGAFTLPLTQQSTQIHNQQKLPTIHYQYFPS
ncbi:putative zinc finger protein 91-like isoform X2 [Penaeus vannamei]|uniref:Putative zinc finger protein 91-like isoform X2 n=1 Tax=Penaeus vannamei TaxID=6689 RepID=A0A423TH41_PENVA|nr:putative zinc finger protein 91-like isoform X2 [Penaeus vannamei]